MMVVILWGWYREIIFNLYRYIDITLEIACYHIQYYYVTTEIDTRKTRHNVNAEQYFIPNIKCPVNCNVQIVL